MPAPVAVRARPSRSTVAPIPLVTVLSAPRLDPPYDDEREPEPWLARQEAAPRLPLEWGDSRDLGITPRRHPPADPASARPSAHSSACSPEQAARPQALPPPGRAAARGGPSEARIAARRFLTTLLEVLDGYRPAGHLRRLTLPSAFAAVAEEVAQAMQRGGTASGAHGRVHRFRLRELRVCEPRAGAAEVTAVLGRGERVFAVALRLERSRASWLCTVAQVV